MPIYTQLYLVLVSLVDYNDYKLQQRKDIAISYKIQNTLMPKAYI